MSVYNNNCGKFVVDVSDGGPMWVKITGPDGEPPKHIVSDDLYDLHHLITQAIAAVERQEDERFARRWRA